MTVAASPHEFLAATILNEEQVVSYRSLSRAFKLNVNSAKQVLYGFYRKQNAKRSGSVHATYLIAGSRQVGPTVQTNGVRRQDDEDIAMQSSPMLPSSSAPDPNGVHTEPFTVRSMLLVKEEDLERAKLTFETISSLHIYSLEAKGLGDVQLLTECNRTVATNHASEDPMTEWKQYGTIQNPNVKRRSERTVPPPSLAVSNASSKPLAQTPNLSRATSESKTISASAGAEPVTKGQTKPERNKMQSSDIFKSFAKGKTKPQQESQSSAEVTPKLETEDVPMGGFSEDDNADDEPDDDPMDQHELPAGKSKKEREAELQAMMDREDEPIEEAPSSTEETYELEEPIDHRDSQKEEEPRETATVENGRRRGRRRIMKKKTIKDEKGYLVTTEEAAWESFSEEEPKAKRAKIPPSATGGSTSANHSTKKSGKPGQGNIMSFFAKK